jgi:hypothetical protein
MFTRSLIPMPGPSLTGTRDVIARAPGAGVFAETTLAKAVPAGMKSSVPVF